MLSFQKFILLTSAIFSVLGNNVHSKENEHWRFWTSKDGFFESRMDRMSISPTGNVIITHEVPYVSRFDGYRTQYFPRNDWLLVKESIDGEIWSMFWERTRDKLGGFQQYKNNSWIKHPIGDFESGVWPVPFEPVGKEVILYLLPDRLMKFDVKTMHTNEIINRDETSLSKFNEMIFSKKGGIWISGANGAIQLKKMQTH